MKEMDLEAVPEIKEVLENFPKELDVDETKFKQVPIEDLKFDGVLGVKRRFPTIVSFEAYASMLKSTYAKEIYETLNLTDLYEKYVKSQIDITDEDTEYAKYCHLNREEKPFEDVENVKKFLEEYPFLNEHPDVLNFKLYKMKLPIFMATVVVNQIFEVDLLKFNSKEGLALFLMNNPKLPIRQIYVKYIDGMKHFVLIYYKIAKNSNEIVVSAKTQEGIEFR